MTWHRGSRWTHNGTYCITNATAIGATLRRTLRSPSGYALLGEHADTWTCGGCWPLGRALLRWARTHGLRAHLMLVAAHAGPPRGDTPAPIVPQHVVTWLTLPNGTELVLDGDGAGRPDEVLQRLIAVDGYMAPEYRPYRAASCWAGGFDFGGDHEEALVAFLSAALATVVLAFRPSAP